MEIEHEIKVIPVDDNLPTEVSKMVADGWQIVPGVKPVAIYHVVRVKKQPDLGGMGELKIDESKIHILRDGKLVQ
jgi:hypothetical protein